MWEEEYDPLIQEAAKIHARVDPALIKAVIARESSGKPGAVSGAGARGLMQLMPATAKSLGVKNIHDPMENIRGGTQYLSQLIKKYDGDVKKALVAYNAGPGNVARGTAPRSSWDYAAKVLSTMPPAPASTPQALPRATIEIPTIPQPAPAPAPAPPPMPRFSRQLVSPQGMPMPGISNLLSNEEELTEDQQDLLRDVDEEVVGTASPVPMIGEGRVAMNPGLVYGPMETITVTPGFNDMMAAFGDTMTVTPSQDQLREMDEQGNSWREPMGWKEKLARIGVPLASAIGGLIAGGGDSNLSYALGGFAKGFAEDTHSQLQDRRQRERELEDRALAQARKDYGELQGLDLNTLQQLQAEGKITAADMEDIQSAFRDYTTSLGKQKITPKEADRLSLAYHRIKSKMPGLESMQEGYLEHQKKAESLRRIGVPEKDIPTILRISGVGMTKEEYEKGGSGVVAPGATWVGQERNENTAAWNQTRAEDNAIKRAQQWSRLQLDAQKFGVRADQVQAASQNAAMKMQVEAMMERAAAAEQMGDTASATAMIQSAYQLIGSMMTNMPGAPPGAVSGVVPQGPPAAQTIAPPPVAPPGAAPYYIAKPDMPSMPAPAPAPVDGEEQTYTWNRQDWRFEDLPPHVQAAVRRRGL